ncbi:hypothetical protein HHI36_018220 [Cryptolaemus montrouzieri]|uniref:Uncharacterized protein n=1 Tax=Cryptolaemus montrouzieri TaxID=559131 RepID=A0ABD2NZD1_9CUCU
MHAGLKAFKKIDLVAVRIDGKGHKNSIFVFVFFPLDTQCVQLLQEATTINAVKCLGRSMQSNAEFFP